MTKSCRPLFLAILYLLCLPCTCCLGPQAYRPSEDHPHIRLLQSYTPDETVPLEFYTSFGFRDWWRLPLAYPYSIHTIDLIDCGRLLDERRVDDFDDGNNPKAKGTSIDDITHVALNADYLLLRTDESCYPFWGTEEPSEEFIIFSFSTGISRAFRTEREMLARARELGFGEKTKLITLREYSDLFSE